MTTTASLGGPVALRVLPALATAALHAVILLALLARWDFEASRTIEARTITPRIIDAELVTLDRYRPPPKAKQEPPPKSAPKPERAPEPKPAARQSRAQEPAQAKPAEKPETKPAPAPERKPAEPEGMSAEELAELSRKELREAVASEEAARVAVTAEEMAASYAALIQRTVVGYWSRPPSARNGMEALLAVQLVPTGEVVSVSVLRSSGNTAFDRSAINAVERAGSFPELANLPAREFEETFRRFRLLFRPEDLRY